MPVRWKDVGCARIAVADLPALAELRCRREIRVWVDGNRAWIFWEPESEVARHGVVRHILPLPGAELFAERSGRWYRLGEHLPAFDVPASLGSSGVPLERVLLPKPVVARRPGELPRDPLPVRLVRDPRGQTQPASALRCRLAEFCAWADRATSAQLAGLQGACTDGPGGAEVLVLTRTWTLTRARDAGGALPLPGGGSRFWGTEVLIPVGFRTDPDLPDAALRRAVEAGPGELVVLDWDGLELIPTAAFRPLSRAGLRLTRERQGIKPGPPWGERRS